MIDIHCHILPNVDDGPQSLMESLAMLKKSEEDGITHIVATPHCNQNLRLFRGEIVPQVARLNEQAQQYELGITVLPGSEIALYDTDVYRHNYEENRYCHIGNNPEYSLIEFAWKKESVPDDSVELIEWIVGQGTTPIIAHPERTPFLRENRDVLAALVGHGAWLQITVDSLLGNMHPLARDAAREMMEAHENIVLATDSHSLTRCSGLSAGYELVRGWYGAEREAGIRGRGDTILQQILSTR